MKNIFKRVLALCLSLVLVAVLLPVSPVAAATGDVTADGIVLLDEDFSQYESMEDLFADGTVFEESSNYRSANFAIENLPNGNKALKVKGDGSTRSINLVMDLNLPKIDSYVGTYYVKIEAEIEHLTSTGQYIFDVNNDISVGVDGAAAKFQNKSYSGLTSASSPGRLDEGSGTVVSYYRVDNACTKVGVRLGMYKNASGEMLVKAVKVTLLPFVSQAYTNSNFKNNTATFIANLQYNDAYVKLTGNLSLEGDVVLGKNAVVDLNGYTLTVNGALNAGVNARIVDTSAGKSGKISVAEGKLLIGNIDHPTLPLWTGSEYILTDPQLGNERAFFVDGSISADGFTLDFRPGFGTAGGVNVREEYLAKGDCGINMDAQLSWTDFYGTSDSIKLVCDNIFTGMYRSENSRGRLALTGAEKYQTISLGITLSSCGVQKSFTMPTFSNADNVTVHFAAESLSYTEKKSDTHKFAAPIDTTAADKLVLDFDLQVPGFTNDDRFAFRLIPADEYRATSSGYFALFSHDCRGGQNLTATCQDVLCRVDDIGTAETVNYRLEVDIATGAWVVYKDGVRANSGAYPDDGYSVTAAEILNGINSVVLRIDTAEIFNFSKVALYSVNTGA